nr:hypothetical protein [Tanacetum cinerariifolium]
GLRLLKSAVVYGANASGKSKLVDALNYMEWFVAGSSTSGQIGKPTGVEPFKLNPESAQDSSEFEIQFIHQNELYRYGFELTTTRVVAEWLFIRTAKGVRNKPEVELFYRTGQNIEYNSRRFGGIVNELVKNSAIRENALLLSVAAQFNQPRAIAILKWFKNLIILSGNDEEWERALTFIMLRHSYAKKNILSFLESADLDIESIQEGESKTPFDSDNKSDESGEVMRTWVRQEHLNAKTMHKAYNSSRELVEPVEFSLFWNESAGTKKLFDLAGPILSSIDFGWILIVDEMDARLHPNLSTKIVQLFNS